MKRLIFMSHLIILAGCTGSVGSMTVIAPWNNSTASSSNHVDQTVTNSTTQNSNQINESDVTKKEPKECFNVTCRSKNGIELVP